MCKICTKIHPKNLPNGRILTYLECHKGFVSIAQLSVFPDNLNWAVRFPWWAEGRNRWSFSLLNGRNMVELQHRFQSKSTPGWCKNCPITLPKFNSPPLKSYQNPIGKACLPTIIFQGRAVKLREGIFCLFKVIFLTLYHGKILSTMGFITMKKPPFGNIFLDFITSILSKS